MNHTYLVKTSIIPTFFETQLLDSLLITEKNPPLQLLLFNRHLAFGLMGNKSSNVVI